MMKAKRYILCAAVWFNDGKKHDGQPRNIETGFIVAGRRHSDCYTTARILNESGMFNIIHEKMDIAEVRKKHQGFITSDDLYVTRKEAWKIAKEAEQIKYGWSASDDEILISENLY